MMRAEEFQSLVDQFKRRQPFIPFVIETDYGERILVNAPDELQCLHGSGVHTRPKDGSLTFVGTTPAAAGLGIGASGLAAS